MRAERRCGELLATVDRSNGGRPEKNSSKPETSYQATLRENDLHPATADRYQQLAAMPDEHFETAVASALVSEMVSRKSEGPDKLADAYSLGLLNTWCRLSDSN